MSATILRWRIPATPTFGPWRGPSGMIAVVQRNPDAPIASIIGPQGPAGPQGIQGIPGTGGVGVNPIAVIATTTGAQTVAVAPIARAMLSINGLVQRPQDCPITAGSAVLNADLLITTGDVLAFTPY